MKTQPGRESQARSSLDSVPGITSVDDPTIRTCIERYASNSSAFLALNEGNLAFIADGIDGCVPFRQAGSRHLAVMCGPIARAEQKDVLLRLFLDFAKQNRWEVLAAQVSREDAEVLSSNGFVVNQLGTTFSIDLSGYRLSGKRMKRVRNKVSQSMREGVIVKEVQAGALSDIGPELERIDAEWLKAKGSHVKEVEFLIGERRTITDDVRRTYIAERAGSIVAYSTFVPSYGARPGFLWDLTRRADEAPLGVVEHIFTQAAEDLRSDGVEWLHLGLTPFVGLDDSYEFPGRSAVTRIVVRGFSRFGEKIYPSAANEFFKNKLRPTDLSPEYIAFHGGVTAGAVLALLKTTRVV